MSIEAWLNHALDKTAWRQLSIEEREDGAYRISGLYQRRARCLTLLPLPNGMWRWEEAGQIAVIAGPSSRHKKGNRHSLPVGQAPMNALVREFAIVPNSEVEAGDILYTLESMKMQVQVTAPTAGRVQKVLVQVGEKVKQGQDILTWEPHDERSKA